MAIKENKKDLEIWLIIGIALIVAAYISKLLIIAGVAILIYVAYKWYKIKGRK